MYKRANAEIQLQLLNVTNFLRVGWIPFKNQFKLICLKIETHNLVILITDGRAYNIVWKFQKSKRNRRVIII